MLKSILENLFSKMKKKKKKRREKNSNYNYVLEEQDSYRISDYCAKLILIFDIIIHR